MIVATAMATANFNPADGKVMDTSSWLRRDRQASVYEGIVAQASEVNNCNNAAD
jgi:hypothetical protein